MSALTQAYNLGQLTAAYAAVQVWIDEVSRAESRIHEPNLSESQYHRRRLSLEHAQRNLAAARDRAILINNALAAH